MRLSRKKKLTNLKKKLVKLNAALEQFINHDIHIKKIDLPIPITCKIFYFTLIKSCRHEIDHHSHPLVEWRHLGMPLSHCFDWIRILDCSTKSHRWNQGKDSTSIQKIWRIRHEKLFKKFEKRTWNWINTRGSGAVCCFVEMVHHCDKHHPQKSP